MSYDRQIDQVCPHLVVGELLPFVGDRQTVRPLRPIASSDTVVVRVNGEMTVPSFGVQAPASTVGVKEGPFTITGGVNNVFSLRVNSGSVQTATLPSSSRMPLTQMVRLLNEAITGVEFSADRSFLRMRSLLSGRDATIFVEPTSTLAPLVGIKTNREFRGRDISPGWTLVSDPTTLTDRPTRLVVFDEPLRGFNDYVEINYTTIRQECRRCGGLGVENDWRYGRNGSVAEVRQEALLVQELMKIMYTVKGSNPFHPWYGTTIVDQIGAKFGASGIIQNAVQTDVNSTFARWQEIKTKQETGVQFVSDEEFPFRLVQVRLEESQKDPTVMFVNIDVQNRSQRPIQLTRGIRLPMPVDLLGSTQQQGVIRQSLRNFTLVG